MDEDKIRIYFLQQVRALIERYSREQEGFLAYFAERAPRDEEILGLIAVSTLLSAKHHLSERFPSPAEALAALSPEARAEICRAFRAQVKVPRQRPLTTAA